MAMLTELIVNLNSGLSKMNESIGRFIMDTWTGMKQELMEVKDINKERDGADRDEQEHEGRDGIRSSKRRM